ncbi:MAG: DUF6100 family protein [Candidatus Gastranaerophilaceae bacterium]
MGTGNTFSGTLAKLESQVRKLNMALNNTRYMYDIGNMELTFEVALRLADVSERTTLLARALPAYTGNPRAAREMDIVMERNIPVEIGFSVEGWFCVRMPLLLPKKPAGSASYVRAFLYPALRDFFKDKPPVRYRGCVLAYRHVYDRDRPERQRRDHDNIEVNMVSDILALYAMDDDGPSVCSHYYCSAAAGTERTEVYLLPSEAFPEWLAVEKEMPDEGVKLYENDPRKAQKDM